LTSQEYYDIYIHLIFTIVFMFDNIGEPRKSTLIAKNFEKNIKEEKQRQ